MNPSKNGHSRGSEAAQPADLSALIGRRIGGYEIEERLATGGMGTVFTAIQPGTRRRVALKLLRPGLVDPELTRRFALEIEILGRLHHRNIARVYEGGSERLFSTEIPYFAMEFVPNARPIHRYAAEKGLDVEARVEMFTAVCEAISHAHVQGVIHRDLKSENILVDAEEQDPAPKVIDFGIARSTDGRREGATSLTAAGQIMGTLESMSPEQARGAREQIDVRTDVYALGVVLYKLLTGRPPLKTADVPLPEALRVILEEEPDPPSKHAEGVRAELDAIVLKCLAKEKENRYDSVRALKEDVAYLEGHTVSASPPSAFDLLARTLRRYRAALIPAVLVFALALAAAAVSTRFALQSGKRTEDVNRLAYRTSLNAASAALADAKVEAARRFLGDAPSELRGWEWDHVASRLAPRSRSIGRELGVVNSNFTMSPDGGSYAVFSESDSILTVARVGTGETILEERVPGIVTALTFEDPTRVLALAQGAGGGAFHRWWIDDGRHEAWTAGDEIVSVNTHLRSGGYTPARGGLYAVNFDSRLRVYSLSDRRLVHEAAVHGRTQIDEFSPTGSLLASGQRSQNGDFEVVVYDVDSWSREESFNGHRDDVNDLAFTPDERLVIGACADGGIYVWDLGAPSSPIHVFGGSRDAATRLDLSDDGELLAAASADAKIRIWHVAARKLITTLGVGTPILGGLEFGPGTRTLYAAYTGSPVLAWDLSVEDPGLLAEHASYVYPVEISESAGLVLSGGWDGYVGEEGCLRWSDLATGQLVARLGPVGAVVLDAEISPDETEALVTVYTPDPQDPVETAQRMARVGSSPLAAAPASGLVARVSMSSGEVLGSYAYPHTIHFLAVDPEYRRAALSDLMGRIRVVDLEDGAVLHATRDQFGEARERAPVAWSPDGRWIAAALSSGRLEIWDAETYRVVADMSGHDDWIWSLAFDAESRRLLSASNDQTIGVWSVPDGAELARLTGHGAGVLCAKFHPDGTRIVSGARGGEVWLWRADGYEPVMSVRAHDSYVFDLEWTADGRTLVTGSGDGTVRVWETDPLSHRLAAREERMSLVEEIAADLGAPLAAGTAPETILQDLLADRDRDGREARVIRQEILARSLRPR